MADENVQMVRCLRSHYYFRGMLTVGKLYPLLRRMDDKYIMIIDDKNQAQVFEADNFELIHDEQL